MDEYDFAILDREGVYPLEPLGPSAKHLSILIGIVNSGENGDRAWERIQNAQEFADGYVWYGPAGNDFVGDVDFEGFVAAFQKKHGLDPDPQLIWGIKADWVDGTTFILYPTLLKILDFSRRVRTEADLETDC